jgi:flagellin
MRIRTDVAGVRNAARLDGIGRALASNFERLATGERVNRASDDPAAIPVIEELAWREEALTKRIDGLAMEEAREGFAAGLVEMMQNLKGVVVAAANRDAMSREEVEGLQREVGFALLGLSVVGETTTFNGEKMFGSFSLGSLGSTTIVDADYARGASELVRNQVLRQAAIRTTLLSRNQRAETVLALLDGVGRTA